jgi:hypothetical protein
MICPMWAVGWPAAGGGFQGFSPAETWNPARVGDHAHAVVHVGVVIERREALAADLVAGGVVEQHLAAPGLHRGRELLQGPIAVARRALVDLFQVGPGRHRFQVVLGQGADDLVDPVVVGGRRERPRNAQRRMVAEDRLLDVDVARRVDLVRPARHLEEALRRLVAPVGLAVGQDQRRAGGRGLVPMPAVALLVLGPQGGGQEGRGVVVEPILGPGVEVEVHHGEAFTGAEGRPVPCAGRS